MEKDRKWQQTEEAFKLLRSVNRGGESEATMAVMRLEEMLPSVIAPVLRGRLVKVVRDFRNKQIIKGIKGEQAS